MLESAYKLFTDGGSRGNPGHAAIGWLIFTPQNELFDFGCKYINLATNNQAEYHGIIEGLKFASKNNIKNLMCHLDSELVVKQISGEYKIKNTDIMTLKEKLDTYISKFSKIEFVHVRREQNKFADKLVNIALDNTLQK